MKIKLIRSKYQWKFMAQQYNCSRKTRLP